MSKRLIIAIFALLALDLLLTVLISFRIFLGRKVLVVPGAKGEQFVVPDEIAREQVVSFAVLYLNSIDNFNPDILEDNIRYILPKVSARFYHELKERYRKLASQVKQSQLSGQINISMKEITIVRFDNKEGVYLIRIPAEKGFYSRGKLIGLQHVVYNLQIRRGAVSGTNPYGLYVTGQSITDISLEEGE